MTEHSQPVARPTDERTFYRVEQDDYCVCNTCHQDAPNWTIVSGTGDDECGIGQSWGDKETADDICDLMNMAYDRGREKLEPVFKLASELCDAIDAEEADIGGHRRARDILGELGPAVEAAK